MAQNKEKIGRPLHGNLAIVTGASRGNPCQPLRGLSLVSADKLTLPF